MLPPSRLIPCLVSGLIQLLGKQRVLELHFSHLVEVNMSYNSRSDVPPRMNRSNSNECRLYVGNLPDDIRSRDIEDVFYKYGSIRDVELKLPKGRGTPYAFVEFDDPR